MTDETKAPELIYVDYNNGLYPDVFLAPEECGEQSEYVRLEAVRANPAEFGVEVKVKQLVWNQESDFHCHEIWIAEAPFGQYQVFDPIELKAGYYIDIEGFSVDINEGPYDDIDTAKSAATHPCPETTRNRGRLLYQKIQFCTTVLKIIP